MTDLAVPLHMWLGWAAIGVCGASGAVALLYHFFRRRPDRVFKALVTLSVLSMMVQVGLGLLLFARDLEPGSIHMFLRHRDPADPDLHLHIQGAVPAPPGPLLGLGPSVS